MPTSPPADFVNQQQHRSPPLSASSGHNAFAYQQSQGGERRPSYTYSYLPPPGSLPYPPSPALSPLPRTPIELAPLSSDSQERQRQLEQQRRQQAEAYSQHAQAQLYGYTSYPLPYQTAYAPGVNAFVLPPIQTLVGYQPVAYTQPGTATVPYSYSPYPSVQPAAVAPYPAYFTPDYSHLVGAPITRYPGTSYSSSNPAYAEQNIVSYRPSVGGTHGSPRHSHQKTGSLESVASAASARRSSLAAPTAAHTVPPPASPLSEGNQSVREEGIGQTASASDAFYEERLDWAVFAGYWEAFIEGERAQEDLAYVSAGLPLPSSRRMATTEPSFEDCERIVLGLASQRHLVTVEKLKNIIKGINSSHLPRVAVTGNKADLVARVQASIRAAAAQRNPEYHKIAKIAGEAQGIQYGATAESAAASTSRPYLNEPTTYSASTSNYHPTASTSSQHYGSSPLYASRSDQFGLHRSPLHSPNTGHAAMPNMTAANGRNGSISGSSSTSTPRYGGYNGASSTAINGSRYPPIPPPQNRYSAAGASSGSSAYNPNSRYGSSLNSTANVPDRWPERLPPKGSTLPPNQPAVPISFKNSPFFKIHSAVTAVTTLTTASGDRHSAIGQLVLTEDQRQKLATARQDPKSTQWQIRLYCTSSDSYSPNFQSYGSYGAGRNQNVLIEFPAACEAKVNGEVIQANLKGIKKRPGTAAPANVGAARKDGNSASGYPLNLTPGAQNKVELAYVNTDKLYYMVAYMVEATTIEQIVQGIKTHKHRRKEEVVKKLLQQAEDPDIQATSSTISLRDPLMFMRITTPVRSVHCPHLQCFDASLYLQMMETTPDWKCPVCNKPISADDLVLDGFTNDIKDSVPDSVDTIIVEVDGTWRSEDSKHGNAVKVTEAKARASAAASESAKPSMPPGTNGANGHREGSAMSLAGTPFEGKPDISRSGSVAGANGKAKSTDAPPVIELDDDDDDDDYPVRRSAPYSYTAPGLSSSTHNGSTTASGAKGKGSGAVIDLTLSDDEDDVAPARPSAAAPAATSGSGNGTNTNGTAPSVKERGIYSSDGVDEDDDPPRASGGRGTAAGQKRRAGSDWDSDSGFGYGSEAAGHANKVSRYA